MSMAVPSPQATCRRGGQGCFRRGLWGGTARRGPDLQPALGGWGPSFPVGAHVFTCVMPQLPQAGGAEVGSCSQACSRTCLGKRTLLGRCPAWRGGQAASTGWEQDSEGEGARTELQTQEPGEASQAVRGGRGRDQAESKIGAPCGPPRAWAGPPPACRGASEPRVEVGPGW